MTFHDFWHALKALKKAPYDSSKDYSMDAHTDTQRKHGSCGDSCCSLNVKKVPIVLQFCYLVHLPMWSFTFGLSPSYPSSPLTSVGVGGGGGGGCISSLCLNSGSDWEPGVKRGWVPYRFFQVFSRFLSCFMDLLAGRLGDSFSDWFLGWIAFVRVETLSNINFSILIDSLC